MSDGGQRLLDVIDDPNALESFLGGLDTGNELLPPADVVASLARSLVADYDVDSPSDTLFESLDSSNNLTDISQSYVPSDFENGTLGNDGYLDEAIGALTNGDPPPSSDQQHFGVGEGSSLNTCDSSSSAFPLPGQDGPEFLNHQQQPSGAKEPPSLQPAFSATPDIIVNSFTGQIHPPTTTSTSIQTTESPQPQQQVSVSVAVRRTSVEGMSLMTSAGSQTQFQIVQSPQQQLIASTGTQGGSQVMQIQTNPSQFITMDGSGNPTLISAGGTSFGSSGLALVTAGGQQTFVMPQGAQFLSNTLMQPQLQAAIKGANGQFFQTSQIVTPTGLGQQIRPKQPQLLPKPVTTQGGSIAGTITTPSMVTTNVGGGDLTSGGGIELGQVGQLIQQQIGNAVTSGMTLAGQQSFAIGTSGTGGIGQVMVSGVSNLSTVTNTQQNSLSGTIVLNQFGQPVILPAASAGQSGGYQLIYRQQPTQGQPMLIQASSAGATLSAQTLQGSPAHGGKPMVRFVSQLNHVNQNQTVQIQPIQTANGISWAIVRGVPQTQASITTNNNNQFGQPMSISTIQSNTVQGSFTTHPQIINMGTGTEKAQENSVSSSGDSSTEPPPKKKSKKKQKVTLDLSQLLKQSGIMDEDLNDDPFDFGMGDPPQPNGVSQPNESPKTNGLTNSKPNLPVSVLKGKEVRTSPKKKSKKKKSPEKIENPPIPPPEKPKNSPKRKTPQRLVPTQTLKPTTGQSSIQNPISIKPEITTTPKTSKININNINNNNNKIKRIGGNEIGNPPSNQITPQGGPSLINAPAAITPANANSNPPGTTRIVQTIQLTQANQQLLRNIQAQISRLLSLPQRNETERTALQKLIVLQNQVISTGTPVPNPVHLNNLGLGNKTGSVAGNGIGNKIASGSPMTPSSVGASSGVLSSVKKEISSPDSIISPSLIKKVQLALGGTCGNNVLTAPHLGGNKGVVEVGVKADNNNLLTLSSSTPTLITSIDPKKGSGMPITISNQVQYQPKQIIFKGIEEQKADNARIALARAKLEEEARIKWKKENFEMRLQDDQAQVLEAEYDTPFQSLDEAIERLMKYHVCKDRNERDFAEFDNGIAVTATHLLNKFTLMTAKYRSLLYKESMREVSCAERVMLERIFVNEEKMKLEQDRLLVTNGEALELPSPPTRWIPKIREMVEKDMKDLERDSIVNQQVQSAIDSIISCGNPELSILVPEEGEKIEYDAFGVPTNTSANFNSRGPSASSADIDEAVRSILS